MGTLFGFVVGYVLGARVGNKGFEEVVTAAREVKESEEFRALLGVLQSHAQGTLSIVSRRLAGDDPVDDMLARAQERAGN